MKLGRSNFYPDSPGLDQELDKIYQFLNFLSDDINPRDIGEPNAGLGHITKALQVGDSAFSPVISNYMTIEPDDAERVIPANGRLHYGITDSDFPVLTNMSHGITIASLYRVPWNSELQLTYSKPSTELKVRLTNDTGSDITIAAGKWYITLISHQE